MRHGRVGEPLILRARLRDAVTVQPLSSRTIIFTVQSQVTSAITDADGIAEASLFLDNAAGEYTVTATYQEPASLAGPETDASASQMPAAAVTAQTIVIGGLVPDAATATLAPGETLTENKTATLTRPPPDG